MQNKDKEAAFKSISNDIMSAYHKSMQEFLVKNSDGSMTDADVIFMIMNLSTGIAINIYYTLKQILPDSEINFDFLKATMCNHIIEGFDGIKNFNPTDTLVRMTKEQIKEATEKGFVDITHPDGRTERIFKKDIIVKRKDANKLIENEKKEAQDAASTNKIIKPRGRVFPGRYN